MRLSANGDLQITLRKKYNLSVLIGIHEGLGFIHTDIILQLEAIISKGCFLSICLTFKLHNRQFKLLLCPILCKGLNELIVWITFFPVN